MDLPDTVRERLNDDFKGYSIDDLVKITKKDQVVYEMELNSFFKKDWEVVIDQGGSVMEKRLD